MMEVPTHQTVDGKMSQLGSFADLGAYNRDIRFTPINRHRQHAGSRPKVPQADLCTTGPTRLECSTC